MERIRDRKKYIYIYMKAASEFLFSLVSVQNSCKSSEGLWEPGAVTVHHSAADLLAHFVAIELQPVPIESHHSISPNPEPGGYIISRWSCSYWSLILLKFELVRKICGFQFELLTSKISGFSLTLLTLCPSLLSNCQLANFRPHTRQTQKHQSYI